MGEDIGGEGAVEAFVLALSLGVVRPRRGRAHPEAEQPGSRAASAGTSGAPVRPVVGGDCSPAAHSGGRRGEQRYCTVAIC